MNVPRIEGYEIGGTDGFIEGEEGVLEVGADGFCGAEGGRGEECVLLGKGC
jgi:hypothetical protein